MIVCNWRFARRATTLGLAIGQFDARRMSRHSKWLMMLLHLGLDIKLLLNLREGPGVL